MERIITVTDAKKFEAQENAAAIEANTTGSVTGTGNSVEGENRMPLHPREP